MYVSLKITYLLYIVWFISWTHDQQHCNSCLRSLSSKCFPHKAHCSLLVLRNTRQHFSTVLGNKITNNEEKKMVLKTLQKEYLFIVWELKQKAAGCLYHVSWERVWEMTQIFVALKFRDLWYKIIISIDFVVTSTFSMWIHKYGICE